MKPAAKEKSTKREGRPQRKEGESAARQEKTIKMALVRFSLLTTKKTQP